MRVLTRWPVRVHAYACVGAHVRVHPGLCCSFVSCHLTLYKQKSISKQQRQTTTTTTTTTTANKRHNTNSNKQNTQNTQNKHTSKQTSNTNKGATVSYHSNQGGEKMFYCTGIVMYCTVFIFWCPYYGGQSRAGRGQDTPPLTNSSNESEGGNTKTHTHTHTNSQHTNEMRKTSAHTRNRSEANTQA